MKQKLTLDEIEKRSAKIDAMEPEEPTPEDLAAFAEADAEAPAETVTLEEYKAATDPGLGVEHELIEAEMVIAGAEQYNELEKAERNAAFLGKLERGLSQVQAGQGIVKSMDELEAMAEDAERILKEFADDYERMAK